MYSNYEIWWVTGAQLLYGGDAVVSVDAHSKEMVDGLNNSGLLPVKVVYKGTANSSHEVEDIMKAANNDPRCAGIITWMHTFSPAKMWIHGLKILSKPLLHFHTQYNAEIPWDTMDMDFMNLNQSAHGDREFGHICARMRVRRKVVTGYWKDPKTLERIAVWQRVCVGWADSQDMLIIRLGDQMNNVAVTDGDKVEAEIRLGYHVDYMPFSSLMKYFDEVQDSEVDDLVKEYFTLYAHDASLEDKNTEAYQKVWNAAKAELTLRRMLKAKGAKAFTTNFDDLGDFNVDVTGRGFDQSPGLAAQRLMAEGYGFGAEGDWEEGRLYHGRPDLRRAGQQDHYPPHDPQFYQLHHRQHDHVHPRPDYRRDHPELPWPGPALPRHQLGRAAPGDQQAGDHHVLRLEADPHAVRVSDRPGLQLHG